MTTPGEWYASLPPICKTWGTTLLGMSLLTNFNLASPGMLILSFPLVFSKFQVWRLLTCFLWPGPLGINTLFKILMIIQCGVKLEQDVYAGRPADFLFMLIFGMMAMLPCTLIPFFSFPILSPALVTMVVYLWSRAYPNQNVSIYGLFSVPAFYFPWLLVLMSLLMGGNVFMDLLGCIVGHLFFFLDTVYPSTAGRPLLETPHWVYWLIYKWAESAPDMFPANARLPPEVQRMQSSAGTRPMGAQAPAPSATPPPSRGGGPSSGLGGAPGRPGAPPPQQSTATQSSRAFQGRSYRLDRD